MKNPHVEIEAGGQHYNGNARTITDKNRVSEIIELFKKKHGASDIKKYYPNPNVAGSLQLD